MPLPDANLTHPCFRQPPDPSVPVWRYIDLSKLMFMLLRRKLTLSRLDTMPDKFEGFHGRNFESDVRPRLIAEFAARPPTLPAGRSIDDFVDQLVKDLAGSAKRWRGVAYINSWCLGANESEAMWRIYGQSPSSVVLKLSYARLRDSLDDPALYIAPVRYFDFERSIVVNGNAYLPLIHKRHEFEYEHEVRIVKVDHSLLPAGLPPGVWENPDPRPTAQFVNWDPAEHVESIVVSPYAARWQSETIREAVATISPDLAARIVDSKMGTEPS